MEMTLLPLAQSLVVAFVLLNNQSDLSYLLTLLIQRVKSVLPFCVS